MTLHLAPGKDRFFVALVTLPHDLAAAMLNLGRPHYQDLNEVEAVPVVVDPFIGTGTTFLEALKLLERMRFGGADLNAGAIEA